MSNPVGVPPLILVVDGEPGVRSLLNYGLQIRGFRVLTAADVSEALDLLRQHAGEVAAVVVDVNLPGTDGRATIAALRALAPTRPCGLMGGEMVDADAARAMGADVGLFKPFTLDEATHAIQSLLARGTGR